MQKISEEDIKVRIARDNPWWREDSDLIPEAKSPKRVYFDSFRNLSLNFDVKRATVLLGPRRVGKTFMIKQLIHDAIQSGLNPKHILFVSIDTPIYSGISLEKFINYMPVSSDQNRCIVIFDEIQYFRDWEIHLKDLVDNYPSIKFIASGSAAAALKLKSRESGAGRFSDFMLPPLTFYEFLLFLKEDGKYIEETSPKSCRYAIKDIDGLNARFVDYLNYGGYPEAVTNEEIRKNPEQFIKNDIIDKVLLKDLPSLYGIASIQELNKLFSFLAYNAGNEASFENISQESGITKPTIKKYIEYLESAFLIIKVSTVDDNCKTMKRERNFKIYLNNPSMRAALFAPVKADDSTRIGQLTESAIFSQWQHSPRFGNLKYARWRSEGEVDIVYLAGDQRPHWIGEIKWSDRIDNKWEEETRSLSALLRRHKSISTALFTTKTIERDTILEGRTLQITPSAAYCYVVGRNITSGLDVPVAEMIDSSENA
ncbi:MAG: ATP-binding protein [Alphaproteobacteria bacterium]|nr:ATP-binding protein [Alphaproteobacteria bacterium]